MSRARGESRVGLRLISCHSLVAHAASLPDSLSLCHLGNGNGYNYLQYSAEAEARSRMKRAMHGRAVSLGAQYTITKTSAKGEVFLTQSLEADWVFFEELKRGEGAGVSGKLYMSKHSEQTSGWAGHQSCTGTDRAPSSPSPPGFPSPLSLPAPTAPQLHTIDCQVHPGAIGKILFRAVLVQEEHTALVPALVFHPEPVNLERCACLQSDSSCEEGSPKSRVVKERTLKGPPPASQSWSLRPFPEVENSLE